MRTLNVFNDDMPKNAYLVRLKRWMDMDKQLAQGGLNVYEFADEWKVSTKTVERDIADFRALGMEIVRGVTLDRDENPIPRRNKEDGWIFAYRQPINPLFFNSISPTVLEVLEKAFSDKDIAAWWREKRNTLEAFRRCFSRP